MDDHAASGAHNSYRGAETAEELEVGMVRITENFKKELRI